MRPLSAVALAIALCAAPGASDAQEEAPAEPDDSGVHPFLSARLLASWGPDVMRTFVTASIPRFVFGVEIGKLALGAGINLVSLSTSIEEGDVESLETTSVFIAGPTASYAIFEGADGRAQLHVLGSFTFATGSMETQDTVGEGSTRESDVGALGFNAGLIGRCKLVDHFALDVGISFDVLSVTTSGDDADKTDTTLQLVGVLGGTFVI